MCECVCVCLCVSVCLCVTVCLCLCVSMCEFSGLLISIVNFKLYYTFYCYY